MGFLLARSNMAYDIITITLPHSTGYKILKFFILISLFNSTNLKVENSKDEDKQEEKHNRFNFEWEKSLPFSETGTLVFYQLRRQVQITRHIPRR